MSRIFISHISAFEFYRNARFNNALDFLNNDPLRNTIKLQKGNFKPGISPIKITNICNDDVPYIESSVLHIETRSKNPNYHNKSVKIHYLKGDYPLYSYLKYNEDIFIASPELLFVQMAKYLNIVQLMMLGLELCGSYSINNLAADGFIYNIKPITNYHKLSSYVNSFYNKNNNYPGIRKAIKALNYILDNSASPKESDLIIKLCTSHSIGGYGIKNFVSNYEIELSTGATNINGRSKIRPDLVCVKNKIALEYQSRAFHANPKQFEIDKIRSAALVYDGWRVIAFVPSQLNNILTFHEIAKKILAANKQEQRIRTKNFEIKRKNLWMQLSKKAGIINIDGYKLVLWT